MIRSIKLLRNVGVFNSDNTVASHNFKRIVLIYGENGSGKTTLTEILRSLETGDKSAILERRRFGSEYEPQVVLECDGESSTTRFQNGSWNKKLPHIRVFDEAFMDKNVYSGLAVEPQHRRNLHDFVLGEQGVSLSRRKQDLVQLVEMSSQKQREVRDAIPEEKLHGVSVDDFCDLPNMPDIEAKINNARNELDAAQHNSAICNTPLFKTLTLPSFDAETVSRTLSQDLPSLGKTAEASVLEHIESLGDGGESWINDGMRYVSGSAEETCPFCDQKTIGISLIKHYRAYFSEEYVRLKHNIKDVLSAIRYTHSDAAQREFEHVVEANRGLEPFWKQFCDMSLPEIDTSAIVDNWTSARDEIIRLLETKQAAPPEPVSLDSNMLKPYERRMRQIADTNRQLTAYNDTIKEIKEQVSAVSADTVERKLAVLQATEARHSQDIAPLCTAYLQAKADKESAETQRDQIAQKLKEYRDKAFPALQDEVNRYLSCFNTRFSVRDFQPTNIRAGSSCEYSVRVRDTSVSASIDRKSSNAPSIGNTLSTGDRNTLALALFFSSLAKEEHLKDTIVVIDDPVSSLDEYRSLTTIQELRDLAKIVEQMIILSHNKQFLGQAWKIMGSEECLSLKISHRDTGSVIDNWGINLELNAEQTSRQNLLKNYAKDKIGDPQEVAEAIRPYLEASLAMTCSSHYRASRPFMNFISMCRDKIHTPDEILDEATITAIQNIYDYAKQFHHGSSHIWENNGIDSEELRGYVYKVLSVMKPSVTNSRS